MAKRWLLSKKEHALWAKALDAKENHDWLLELMFFWWKRIERTDS